MQKNLEKEYVTAPFFSMKAFGTIRLENKEKWIKS